MSEHKKILCVGTATIDIISVVADSNIEKMSLTNAVSSFLLLETGRKIETDSINLYYGGGALNAAISMTRLGHTSDCFVKIGRDNYGDALCDHLKESHIGTQHIAFSDKDATATSILLSSHERDPAILTYRGANGTIENDDVPWDAIQDYDALYITNLSNQSAKIFPALVSYAHQQNVKVISNPGIRQLGNDGMGNDGNDFYHSLGYIDMLVINRIEAEELLLLLIENNLVESQKITSKISQESPILSSGKLYVPMADFFKALANFGINLIVVTDGKNGAYIHHQHHDIHTKSKPVKAIGTVGAGDAFSSTLAALWLQNMNIKKAAEYAAINASNVVKSLDAQSGLMHYDALINTVL